MATSAEQIAQLQRENNQMYREVAQAQMDFQREMSNSAHQRETKDLVLAGLNPVLSAGAQGASTPSGAQADVDAQSMVSFLINEMNNENAKKLNDAQVSAQRYAADMNYKAAVEAANATRYAADQAKQSSLPALVVDALANPDSNAAKAWNAFLNIFGLSTTQNSDGTVTVNVSVPRLAENKILNWLRSNLSGSPDHTYYMAGQAIPNWLRNNRSTLSQLFKNMGFNKANNLLWSLTSMYDH